MKPNYFPAGDLVPHVGDALDIRLGLSFRPTPRLRQDLTYLRSRLETLDGAPIFTNNIIRGTLNYQFTRELSLRAIVDYNDVSPNPARVRLANDERVGIDTLFTYQLGPATALYVGYTSGFQNLAARDEGRAAIRIDDPSTQVGPSAAIQAQLPHSTLSMNEPLHRRLYAAALLGSCSYAICRTPLLPLLARDLGATPAGVGLIVGASTVMGILLKLPAGAWSDVFGRRVVSDCRGAPVHADAARLHRRRLADDAAWRCASFTAARRRSSVRCRPPPSQTSRRPIGVRTWLSTLSMLQGIGQVAAPLIAGALLSRRGLHRGFRGGRRYSASRCRS